MDIFKLDEPQRTALTALLGDFPEYCTLVFLYRQIPYKKDARLKKLASALAEDPDTVEDVYEPFLMQQGLMMRTPKGRQATAGAWEHLGLVPPEGC